MNSVGDEFQTVLGEGLFAPAEALACGGLELDDLRVLSAKTNPNGMITVRLSTGMVSRQRMGYVQPDRRIIETRSNSLSVVAQPGQALQMAVILDFGAWPPFLFPQTILLQWTFVAGADRYEILDAGGGLLDTVIDQGQGYFTLQSAPIADQAAYSFTVRPKDGASGAMGTDRVISGTMVTIPVDNNAAQFVYNGDLTVDIN